MPTKLIANGGTVKTGGKRYADGVEFTVDDEKVAQGLIDSGSARPAGTAAADPVKDETGLDPKHPRHGDAVAAQAFAAEEAAGAKGLKAKGQPDQKSADGAKK